jgi:hypothetical protein
MSSSKTSQSGSLRALQWALVLSAVCEVVWFTGSHWFWHRRFFNGLGIDGPELESPFVRSQLQLIGGMVLGYALITLHIARDPTGQRDLLRIVMVIGAIMIAIFLGNVASGSVPPQFLVNAGLLAVQIGVTGAWFPPRLKR